MRGIDSEIRCTSDPRTKMSRRCPRLPARSPDSPRFMLAFALIEAFPSERLPVLRDELTLLDRGVERAFHAASDRDRARVADSQGIGASR